MTSSAVVSGQAGDGWQFIAISWLSGVCTLKCVLVDAGKLLDDVVMSAVIEIRTYRAKPGMRAPLLELLESRAFPLQRELGMKVLGPFPSQDDDVGFVWMRGFPDAASREPLKAAFYEGAHWLGGLEAEAMPMLDDYTAVVVDDTADLWSRWPAEAPVTAADA